MDSERKRPPRGTAGESTGAAGHAHPGKASRTIELPAGSTGGGGGDRGDTDNTDAGLGWLSSAPVQLDGGAGGTDDPFALHVTAQAGVSGGGGELPHRAAIQDSFGHHDVSGVRAHVGGGAAASAEAIGASAYATGNDVAFAASPDLRQAAHEAAHVVQQRGGVRLDGGVGREGDPYEQHADAVAERVVRGESAEGLLDTMAHRGSAGGPAVQMDRGRPVRERSVRFHGRVPASYEEFRAQVEERLAREVMSRTEVEGEDGVPAPIRRERALVETSNLQEVFRTLRAGEEYEIVGRLIPGEDARRYVRIEFSLPPPDVVIDEPIRIEGRPPPRGLEGLAGPGYEPPSRVPDREGRWRRAQQILEERLGGAIVGGGPDLMWTPTRSAISRMMPAPPSLTGDSFAGDSVPEVIQRTNPRWNCVPPPHDASARVLGEMLVSRFGRDRMLGTGELTDEAIGTVVDDFIRVGRAAIEMRRERRQRLEVVAQLGGGSMIADELLRYAAAEQTLFIGDATCLWRYVD